MRVFSAWRCSRSSLSLTSHGHDPVTISCVSLQELYLNRVNISQELLDGILSSCRLLTKIELINSSEGLKAIKVKNLPCLCQLKIVTRIKLEINHVPNLRVFTWGRDPYVLFNAHSISLGSNLKHLTLSDMVRDNASLDMIKSGASSLKSLTIDMINWKSESFDFTCASIKRLLLLACQPRLINVKVYAPSLLFFGFNGETMPSLFFPFSTLINQTTFWLDLQVPSIGVSFFLKMRKALGLSSNCDIQITAMNYGPRPLIHVNIDDLRTRLPFPRAVNVQSLSFKTKYDECMWERSPFFDAFFEICHPNHVTAMPDRAFAPKNHFCKVMMTEVLEKKPTTACWPHYLKHVQIRHHTKWETLTNANKSFLEGDVQFKLEWH